MILTKDYSLMRHFQLKITEWVLMVSTKSLMSNKTARQKQLLSRFGNEICLLAATYRTTRYNLPLFFLCVPTNVNYMTVATFIVETEDSVSTQEALSIIKSWNPDWNPAFFMCDLCRERVRLCRWGDIFNWICFSIYLWSNYL